MRDASARCQWTLGPSKDWYANSGCSHQQRKGMYMSFYMCPWAELILSTQSTTEPGCSSRSHANANPQGVVANQQRVRSQRGNSFSMQHPVPPWTPDAFEEESKLQRWWGSEEQNRRNAQVINVAIRFTHKQWGKSVKTNKERLTSLQCSTKSIGIPVTAPSWCARSRSPSLHL